MRARAALPFLVLLFLSGSALAEERRRPGLGGSYSTRNLTAPLNSLGVVLGPGQTPLFGQRYGGRVMDGGISYLRQGFDGSAENEFWVRGGVIFGLTEHLEAGALFLSFRITPDFAYADFPVFLTYGWTFDNVDIGAKLSFLTPAETDIWSLNPGVPLLIRLGASRIDAGAFVPMTLDDPFVLGLNVPLRLTHNLTPKFFAGLESGFAQSSFQSGGRSSIPLGGLLGYSMVLGDRVMDITGSFTWDDFATFGEGGLQDTLQTGAFRALMGVTLHQIVM